MVRPRSKRRRGPSSIHAKIARWRRRALIVATLVFALVLGTMAWLLRVQSRTEVSVPVPKGDQEKAEIEKIVRSGDQGLEVVKRAFAVQDEDVFLRHLRASQRTTATWEEWKRIQQGEGPVTRVAWMSPLKVGASHGEQFLVTFGSGKNRIMTALKAGDGWLLDWDGFARTTVPTWPELIKDGAESATVRVYVAHDEYYQGEFRDDQAWMCVALASPDWDELLFGYVKRDSAAVKRLEELLNQRSPQRVTLRVRGPKGGALKQFEILELLSDSWVLPEEGR